MILGIDTTGKDMHLGLRHADGTQFSLSAHQGLNHSELLPGAIDHLLQIARAERRHIQALCLIDGPGSFTGLRVGGSLAKGIASGLGIRICPVSRLEALLASYSNLQQPLLACIDARRGEYYLRSNQIPELEQDRVLAPARILAQIPRETLIIGDPLPGADVAGLLPAINPCATACSIAAAHPERHLEAADVQLRYLRASEAERQRQS